MKVTLIDYGAGNVPSVARAFHRLGGEAEITSDAERVAAAQALVLPGVGHCRALMGALDQRGLREPLVAAIRGGTPFLGICLGLQALYESSEESPELRGLNLLAGSVTRLPDGVKLPHMGWNQLRVRRQSRLLEGISAEAYFYFAHSYAGLNCGAECTATCEHGREFPAVVERENIHAVQFHPEKSGEAGARLLGNFLRAAG